MLPPFDHRAERDHTQRSDTDKEAESHEALQQLEDCLLYTSDAADERSSVDLGGRRIIKKKKSGRIDDAVTMRNTKCG